MTSHADIVRLDRGAGTGLVIHKHGATITSWTIEGEEMLFLSSKAVFDNKTAIRGGIPIVFPHFGPWGDNKPKHGFARILSWALAEPPVTNGVGDIRVALRLIASPETKAVWNHDFSLLLSVVLKERELEVSLAVSNLGVEPFSFTTLLHNYIRVSAISAISISGFEGLDFLNSLENGKLSTESSGLKRVGGPIDRIYLASPHSHLITDEGKNASIALHKSATLSNTVLWTPWAEGAEKLKDMDDEEYKEFVCVESGCVSEAVHLGPSDTFVAKQTIIKTPMMNVNY